MIDPTYPLLAAMAVSMVLFQVNHRYASPVLAIVNRWLRWLIFAFGAAYVCRDFSLIHRPYLVLVAVFFLVWFLAETLYNWLAIHALSVSPLPLFPRYAANQSGEEWPTQPRLLRVRDWLRRHGVTPPPGSFIDGQGNDWLNGWDELTAAHRRPE